MIRIGLVGYGQWGSKLARVFSNITGVELTCICDSNRKKLMQAGSVYKDAKLTTDYTELFSSVAVDAFVVATTSSSHFVITREALLNHKHVLAEKPAAISMKEIENLAELCDKTQKKLMIDHTQVYSEHIQLLKQMINHQELGNLLYYDSVRQNCGHFQPDISVLLDLGVHDVAIVDYLIGKMPLTIYATGACHNPGFKESMAILSLGYEDNFLAHINLNSLGSSKKRYLSIVGDKKSVSLEENLLTISSSPLIATAEKDERISSVEPLRSMALHFKECIENDTQPITSIYSSQRVYKILESAEMSLRSAKVILN